MHSSYVDYRNRQTKPPPARRGGVFENASSARKISRRPALQRLRATASPFARAFETPRVAFYSASFR